jgi:hypothetical protein
VRFISASESGVPTARVSPDPRVPGFVVLYGESRTTRKERQGGQKKFRKVRAGARGYRRKPTNEMVRRLIPLPEQEDREGSF